MKPISKLFRWWPFMLLICACSGPQQAPPEPLDANPAQGSSEGLSEGASGTEFERGKAYIENGKFEEAKQHLQKALELNPDNAMALALLGVAKERTGDREGAEKAYKEALKLDQKLIDAALNLGALYLENPPRPDEAIAVLTIAVKEVPDDAQLHQNLAYAYGLKKDVPNASKHYEAALATANNANIYLAYGTMLLEAKQLDKAAVQLKKALDKAKDDAVLLGTIGMMLAYSKAYGDCVKALDRAIKLKSDAAELYARRGTCRHELNDVEGERTDYQAAIKIDPKHAPAHYYLGMSYSIENKRQLAIASLEQAVKYGGDSELGKRAAAKLKELKQRK